MNNKTKIALGLVLFTAGACSSLKDQEDHQLPNIIFILSDDLGYGDLGCYGQVQIATPNIDQLAREGMLFTQHYAGSTVCAPSRCVLMTGQHTGHALIRGNKGVKPMGQYPLADSIVTVAELLKKKSYATAAIGKWGLGGPESEGDPMFHGFDHFLGYKCQSHAHNYYPEYIFKDMDTLRLRNIMPKPVASNQTGFATTRIDYTPDLFAKEAIEFVLANKENPFFLYLALTPPHVNNQAPKGLGMEVPDQGEYADKDWPEIEIDKASMITRMDKDIGDLIAAIRDLGIENNTIVFFSSDNGPHKEGGVDPGFFNSAGNLRGLKRDLYEGGIRVPLIAWWPGVIDSAKVSDHISAFWDFLPTVCDLAGIEKPQNTDGISFLNELKGLKQEEHEYLYWEYPVNAGKKAIRYKNWKAVIPDYKQEPEKLELYNLNIDLEESNNIATENPDIVKLLKQYLNDAHISSSVFPFNN